MLSIELVNIMEKVVDGKLEVYMPDSGCCTCPVCVGDVKCLALNNLPSKYVNTYQGELFSRVDQVMLRQNSVDVDFVVLNAIERIKEKPRCKDIEVK